MSFKDELKQIVTERRAHPLHPGDLIQINKMVRSWWSRTHKCNYDTGEPKRWAEIGEIKLILSVEPLNTRGTDVPCTTWLLTCLGMNGIEFFRAHKNSVAINFTLLSPGISEEPASST